MLTLRVFQKEILKLGQSEQIVKGSRFPIRFAAGF